jgi:murein DD-endopeptidase MepM/ murein hydrolase activator NlpD
MLIPHDRSQTRNLDVAGYQIWVVASLIVLLSFSTAFLFKRHQVVSAEAHRLQQAAEELARNQVYDAASVPQDPEGRYKAEIDKLRSEYESSLATITSELSKVYEIEVEARELTGLAPREPGSAKSMPALSGGKGGAPGGLDEEPDQSDDEMSRPPQLIYGLSRPSADLIVQEINLRTASLQNLTADLRAEKDRIERIPSIWPSASGNKRITSRFGYRKDPFTRRVRHHDGTDIDAPYASPVIATAKGVVISAKWENYYGNIVKVDHGNGIESWYAHLKECRVEAGEEVKRSDVIGLLGNTGRSTGAHIHYEVRVKGKLVDSSNFFRD